MSSLQIAEDAHQLYKDLVTAVKASRLFGVILGKFLWQLKADDTYMKAVGQGVDNWNDFLKLPEISLEVREANRSMELYEVFVLKYGYDEQELAEAKTKSLHYLLPHARDGEIPEERIRELVEDAKHLTQAQFKDNLFDAKTGDQGQRTYQFVLMRKCVETGTLQKVHGVDHDMLEKALINLGITINELLMPEVL
jgi:hypothetical protein